MTELSPSAQAVFDAYLNAPCGKSRQSWVAAALRAAAKHSVPDDSNGYYVYLPNLLAIADELDA